MWVPNIWSQNNAFEPYNLLDLFVMGSAMAYWQSALPSCFTSLHARSSALGIHIERGLRS